MKDVEGRIKRATELLKIVRHAAMATVNEDGSPHNTPYFFMCDENLENLYWSSHPDSLHSKNISRTGELFVVLFEPNAGGGLYIKAQDAHEVSGAELAEALKVHNALRANAGKDSLSEDYYTNLSPQRMYRARPVTFWVNVSERDSQGLVRRDYRHEVRRSDLLT